MKTTYQFEVEKIVAKPRMTRADKWKQRPVVLEYWKFADQMRRLADKQNMPKLPQILELEFCIAMPESWSEKKKKQYEDQLHTTKPDIDNLIKSVLDIFCENDSYISSIKATKYYTRTNIIRIII